MSRSPPPSGNLLLFTFDNDSFYFTLVDAQDLSIRDERQFARTNVEEMLKVLIAEDSLEPELAAQYSDSCLVVDENAHLQFLQQDFPASTPLPQTLHRYHSLQKAFSVHLVTLSSYNNNVNRDTLKEPFPQTQFESDNHKQLLKLMMTLLRQGFKFLKPTVHKETQRAIYSAAASKRRTTKSDAADAPTSDDHPTTSDDNSTTTESTTLPQQITSSVNQSSEDSNSEQPSTPPPPSQPLIVDTTVLRLRGLPWTATSADIEKFFAEAGQIENPEQDILIVLNFHGRSTGEAYVKFASVQETQSAATAKDRANMGHRYIELFPASEEEMEKSRSIMERELKELGNSSVARMRGLPQGTKEEEIYKFFEGLHEKVVKILLLPRETSRGPGGAYVEFESPEIVEEALKRNKEKIGTRYIELFRSTKAEMSAAERYLEQLEEYKANSGEMDRLAFPGVRRFAKKAGKRRTNSVGAPRRKRMHSQNPYGNVQLTTHHMMRNTDKFSDAVVRLRGLPFNADEVDIAEFFGDLPIVDQGIHFIYNSNDGKKTGEAYVEFASVEAKQEAMKKDKAMMGKRYIEIFPNAGPRGHHHHNRGGAQDAMGGAGMQMAYYPPQQYIAMLQQWYMMMGVQPAAAAAGYMAGAPQWGREESAAQGVEDGAEGGEELGEGQENASQEHTEHTEHDSQAGDTTMTDQERLELNANANEFVPVFNPNQQMMMAMMNAYQMGMNPVMFYPGALVPEPTLNGTTEDEGEYEEEHGEDDSQSNEAAAQGESAVAGVNDE